jgi:hypothetical protein
MTLSYTSRQKRTTMSFCDHCDGQRFDRAQVLRALRSVRQQLRDSAASSDAEQVIALAIETVRTLAIPHFDTIDDEVVDGEVIH